MHLSVDSSRCQGHALCLTAAPDLFNFDDDAGLAVVITPDVPSGDEDSAKKAAANCPEQAITISE